MRSGYLTRATWWLNGTRIDPVDRGWRLLRLATAALLLPGSSTAALSWPTSSTVEHVGGAFRATRNLTRPEPTDLRTWLLRGWFQRALEVIPGSVTYGLIIVFAGLSLSPPEVVVWAVLACDLYWFSRALGLTGGASGWPTKRIRETVTVDWRARAFALRDLPAWKAELDRQIAAVEERIARLAESDEPLVATGARRELSHLRDELRLVERLLARRAVPIPDPARVWHVALVHNIEPYAQLHATVRALAETNWPTNRRMVADYHPRDGTRPAGENVARLRDEFGDRFLHFLHVLDPLEPGDVAGKGSAMAYGGHWLPSRVGQNGVRPTRSCGHVPRLGLPRPSRVFRYLTCTSSRIPIGSRSVSAPPDVPQPLGGPHPGPAPARLAPPTSDVAIAHTGSSSASRPTPVSLQTLHEVGYWATDAIPEDSRFYWKSFFRYSGEFEAVPALPPDLRGCSPGAVVPRQADPAVHPDPAVGVGRHGHPVLHPERLQSPGDPAPGSDPGPGRPLHGSREMGDRPVRHHLRGRPSRSS